MAVNVVGTVAEKLNNDVSGGKYRAALFDNFRALLGILRVGIAGSTASSRLHMDLETRFGQGGEDGRHERNPPLARIDFFGNANDHETLPVYRFFFFVPRLK